MSMTLKIKTILLERNMNIKDLGIKLGSKGSTLYGKLDRDNFTESDLKEIAEVLNCEYEGVFTYKDTQKKI